MAKRRTNKVTRTKASAGKRGRVVGASGRDSETPLQAAFLAALSEVGVPARACRAAGVSRAAYYKWREDKEFQAKCADAVAEAVEELEGVAMERARRGCKDMLKFLLSRLNRQKYGDKLELGSDGPFEIKVILEGDK